MKKFFYILCIAGIFSSCDNDESAAIVDQELQPEKISAFIASFPKSYSSIDPHLNYEFSYENGLLKKASGKIMSPAPGITTFMTDPYSLFSYNNDKISIQHSEIAGNGAKKEICNVENGKLKSRYLYDSSDSQFSEIIYTYQADKIIVHEKKYTWEYFTTYFFDSNQNLIKSEKLEKSGGIDSKLTTTFYSNFDTAKNPFKKLYVCNDNFYEKSLSKNNYRKIDYTVQDLQNPQFLPGSGHSEWTYSYGSDGQIILTL
ncbi:hypothetical protein [Chryseobacterium takakiae]|uniref:YD repeat-containing protein n=1 Tax=Chryseobacterium takakiae TaxID=1302685 RepID=A0A1M4ZY00_9FLAO|nr:hypothetical protein [Chryseobacterium takakiae]SHF22572.1 hypothetical protein SAMN05444408_11163 [Chryseobacterium takakiae]